MPTPPDPPAPLTAADVTAMVSNAKLIRRVAGAGHKPECVSVVAVCQHVEWLAAELARVTAERDAGAVAG